MKKMFSVELGGVSIDDCLRGTQLAKNLKESTHHE